MFCTQSEIANKAVIVKQLITVVYSVTTYSLNFCLTFVVMFVAKPAGRPNPDIFQLLGLLQSTSYYDCVVDTQPLKSSTLKINLIPRLSNRFRAISASDN